MRRRAIVILTLLPLFAPFLTSPARAAFPGTNGWIAFWGGAGAHARIFLVHADGTGLHPITPPAELDRYPSWSADGAKLVVVRYVRTVAQLVTMRADGSSPKVVLARASSIDWEGFYSPSWSPDGTRIAFCALTRSSFEVFTIRANGTGLTKVTIGRHDDCDPSWSPDGTKLAIDSRFGRFLRLVTMDVDGSHRTPVVRMGRNASPDWAPDGSGLVFMRLVGSYFDVCTVRIDGTGLRDLTKTPRRTEYDPRYAPDGTRIAFAKTQGPSVVNYDDLWLVNPDGSGLRRLTNTPSREENGPSWQPV